MLKLDILIIRRPGMTHGQFVSYWQDLHAPFFIQQPIVRKTVCRYIQSRPLLSLTVAVPLAGLDGIAQLWFKDIHGFIEYSESNNYRDVIRQDEEKFVDLNGVKLLFSEEATIIS